MCITQNDPSMNEKIKKLISAYIKEYDKIVDYRIDFLILKSITRLNLDFDSSLIKGYIQKNIFNPIVLKRVLSVLIDTFLPLYYKKFPEDFFELLKILISADNKSESIYSIKSFISTYNLKKLLTSLDSYVNKDDYDRLLNIFNDLIKDLLKTYIYSFSIDNITLKETMNMPRLNEYENMIINFNITLLKNCNKKIRKKNIKQYFSESHEIYLLMGIHLTTLFYEELNSVFWVKKRNLLKKDKLTYEIYSFLQRNAICLRKNK